MVNKSLALFLFVFALQADYRFSSEPIDVVIPCHAKDSEILPLVIEGVKKHAHNVRRVIVISNERLSDEAEWFDERLFPFTKYDAAMEILKDHAQAEEFINSPNSRIGWIFQQLLKLYAPLVIPDISPNVLILDADTILLKSIRFQDAAGASLFNVGTEYHFPYFEHALRLLPSFKKVFPRYSGICHHMLFQKEVLEDLFAEIKAMHAVEPWQALMRCIDVEQIGGSSFSEYEIYFNFIFSHTTKAKIRPLRWENVGDVNRKKYESRGLDYISCHSYKREPNG